MFRRKIAFSNGLDTQTNMSALDECLSQVATFAYRVNASVGFPKLLGCGLAGGNWDEVCVLIGNYFDFKGSGCTIVEYAPSTESDKDPEPAASQAKKKPSAVTIYTDGSALGNPGKGGWAAILMAGKTKKELSGGDPDTTNNRMEMMGVIQALSALKKPCKVKLYTDSAYVVNSVTKGWMTGWKENGWKKKGGLKNVDLWKQIDKLLQTHDVEFIWVKGHAENQYNNRCDELARAAASRI